MDSKFYQNCKKYKSSYQIGLVCMGTINYGNNLANYALYKYLNDLGYSVLLINYPLGNALNGFDLFEEQPYPECDVFVHEKDKRQYSYTNMLCDMFVLGTDQLWREIFVRITDFFTCLDWVESGKYKIAYATSFGLDSFQSEAYMQKKMGCLLGRFQNISVREEDGVKILKKLYGIEAECVLDPVFLCNKKYYERLAEKGKKRLPERKFVGAYLLDITEKKGKMVLSVSNNVANGVYKCVTERGAIANPNTGIDALTDASIGEWLAVINNCDFFITDSFHGMCFALIFQKQFCVLFDKENWRGLSRFQSLLDLLQLHSRLVQDCNEEKILNLCVEEIDYCKVNAILSKECERSKNWLKNSLAQGDNCNSLYNIYDLFWELSSRIQRSNLKIRNELFLLEHIARKGSIETLSGVKGNMQVVGWGAGECFRRHIGHIKSFCDMKYVCDRDPQKWGKEIDEDVICISPKMLSEMNNIMVIIMVDNVAISFQIARELLEMGITNFEHIDNWISYVEG